MSRRAAGWIAALLALAVLAAAGIGRLRLDVEVLNLLPADLPEVRGLRLHQRHFADADNLLITVEAASAEAAETAAGQVAETLRNRTNLVREVMWQPPFRERPEELASFLAWLWLNQPPARVDELASRLAPNRVAARLAGALDDLSATLSPLEIARLSRDPLGFTRLPAAGGLLDPTRAGAEWFASPDGRFRVLHVRPAHPTHNYRQSAAWLQAVRQTTAELRAGAQWPDDVQLAFTGAPAFLVETATGMERDLRRATTGAFLIIAALFWLAHRRWRPLLGVALLSLTTLLLTAAAGGLIFGRLNTVSLGFAAILLGLGVDYALVLYQEWRVAPGRSPADVRREVGPAIGWAALTTAAAFGLLNFAGLPGLRQLGTLVAIGVLLAAAVMVWAFLPMMARMPKRPPTSARDRIEPARPRTAAAVATDRAPAEPARRSGAGRILIATGGLLVAALGVLVWRPPQLDATTRPLSPRHSAAEAALETLQQRLGQSSDTLWLLVRGDDLPAVAERLAALEQHLVEARARGVVARFELPARLWPRPAWQERNRAALGGLARQGARLRQAVLDAGFTEEAWALAGAVCREWDRLSKADAAAWPAGHDAAWLARRFAAPDAEGWIALGRVDPTGSPLAAADALRPFPGGDSVLLTGWSLLGQALLRRVEGRVGWLTGGIAAVVVLCLTAAFRNLRDVLLVGAACLAAGLGLQAWMSLAGWKWNLLNLAALPLLLGVGVDYAIHVLMNLRRHGGRHDALWQTTGRALLLCGATTMVGFGTLAWAGNAGLAGLGRVCAVGIAWVVAVTLYFLPRWRYAWTPDPARTRDANHDQPPDRHAG